MAFKKDFGSYVKNKGLSDKGKIIITENFTPLDLMIYSNDFCTITANINGMVASFDFHNEVLDVFLSVFYEYKIFDKLLFTQKMQQRDGRAILFRFTDLKFIVKMTGIVLACNLGKTEISETTFEEFTPLIITKADIVKKPAGVLAPAFLEIEDEKNKNDDKIKQTLDIIFNSTRPMPAHFCSNGELFQSFCINFDPLTDEDDELMATRAWGSIRDFIVSDTLAKGEFYLVQRCGEESMIGAYVLTKLGGENELEKLQQAIKEHLIEILAPSHSNIKSLFAREYALKYFDYCSDYGYSLAKGIINAEQLNQYGARLCEEIKLHYLRDFALCTEGENWAFKSEGSMRSFVLSRPGWAKDTKSDELFIFQGKYPITVSILYCGSAGKLLTTTAVDIAKAELIDEFNKVDGSNLEENITKIVDCIDNQDWIIPFVRKKG